MSVNILSADAARQIAMNSDSRINEILKQIEITIKNAAELGYFTAAICWSDYEVRSRDDATKERVKDELVRSGYRVHNSGNKMCDSPSISWRD